LTGTSKTKVPCRVLLFLGQFLEPFGFGLRFSCIFFCFRVRGAGFSNSHCCVCERSHLCNNLRASGHLLAKEAGSQLDWSEERLYLHPDLFVNHLLWDNSSAFWALFFWTSSHSILWSTHWQFTSCRGHWIQQIDTKSYATC